MKTLYIPIKSQNLVHYYRLGLILPANSFENRMDDIQSSFQNAIVLSDKKWTDESDCSLEIVLNELKAEPISQNLFCVNTPIPISRISAIYFISKEQKETTLWNINNSAAFIPESIVKVESNPVEKIIVNHELSNIPQTETTEFDYKEKIERYNSILGGLTFMRIGGKSIMNYSENYFVVLSDFNKHIENELTQSKFQFNTKLKGIITSSTNGWRVLLQHLTKDITKEYVKQVANEKNIQLEEDYILEYDKLDLSNADARIIYYLSIIATYGKGKSKKIEDLFVDLQQDKIKYNKEIVALLFGMYEGYKNIVHKIKEKAVKFKLNSKLDYYTIESIYQYVFNDITENSVFEYIDTWCPIFENKISEKDFVTYQILDKKIIVKKKIRPDSPEFLEQFYQKYMPQYLAEISDKEPLKVFQIEELMKTLEIKNLLNKFQQVLIKNIDIKTDKPIASNNNEKREIKKQNKIYSEDELKRMSLKELQSILNTDKWKTEKPYITRILKKQSKSTLFK